MKVFHYHKTKIFRQTAYPKNIVQKGWTVFIIDAHTLKGGVTPWVDAQMDTEIIGDFV